LAEKYLRLGRNYNELLINLSDRH